MTQFEKHRPREPPSRRADRRLQEMDRRTSNLLIIVSLAALTMYLGWFDYAAVTAVFFPQRDQMGYLRFQVLGYGNTPYPFTYAAAIFSVLGVAYCVYFQERLSSGKSRAAVLGLVIGNLASIGMLDGYEQAIVGLGDLVPAIHPGAALDLHYYWGDPRAAMITLAGILVVFCVLPWARKSNWPGTTLLLGVFAASIGIWYAHGYLPPGGGDSLDYALNASSRIASQAALVAAVAPVDFVRWIVTRIPGRRISQRGEGDAVPKSAPRIDTPTP